MVNNDHAWSNASPGLIIPDDSAVIHGDATDTATVIATCVLYSTVCVPAYVRGGRVHGDARVCGQTIERPYYYGAVCSGAGGAQPDAFPRRSAMTKSSPQAQNQVKVNPLQVHRLWAHRPALPAAYTLTQP